MTQTKLRLGQSIQPPLTRNIMPDGGMLINQSGNMTGSVGSGFQGGADMLFSGLSLLGTWNFSQATTSLPNGYEAALKARCTVAQASPPATAFGNLQWRLEGRRVQRFKKGTADALPITVSFMINSDATGNFVVELYDNDNNRHVASLQSVNSINTWEKKVITFPPDTSGAFDNDAGFSFDVVIWMGAGTNFTSGTLPSSWAALVNANRAVGQTNWAASTNQILITGLQVEVGSEATEFEHKTFSEALRDVQQYYSTNCPYGTAPADGATSNALRTIAVALNTSSLSCARIDFPVNMIAVPAITFYRSSLGSAAGLGCYYNGSSWQNMAAMSYVADAKGLVIGGTAGTVFTTFYSYLYDVIWVADARV